MAGVRLECITPTGLAFEADELSAVVMRRRERQHELGSELVILPRHGPLLVRLPDHVIECRRTGASSEHVRVDGGFAEVLDDTVSVLTSSVEQVDEPDSRCAVDVGSPGIPPA